MIGIIGLVLKVGFFSLGSLLLWESHRESALVAAGGAILVLIIDLSILYQDRGKRG